MADDINYETADRTTVVETRIELPLAGGRFVFMQPLPRYIADKITPDDWAQVGRELVAHRDAVVMRMMMTGRYLRPGGVQAVQDAIKEGCRVFVLRRFKDHQVKAGNSAWASPLFLEKEHA